MQGLLVARLVHFFGFSTWLGSLFAAVGLMLFHDRESDPGFKTRIAGSARGALIGADVGATLAILAGIWMASEVGLWKQPWLHIKLTLVVLLLVVHVFLRIWVKRRRTAGTSSATKLSPAIYGLLTALMVGILYMVIFRPLAR